MAERLSKKRRKKVVLVGGSVHPELTNATAEAMGSRNPGVVALKQFPNTELYARYGDSVRGKHVIIMQSHAAADGRSVNDALMEQMMLINAAKTSSAAEITAVCPLLGYARQDRKAKGREGLGAQVVIGMLGGVGASRIVSVDLHSSQTQAIFNGPFDHLTGQPYLRGAIREEVGDRLANTVVVAPDTGSAKMAEYHRRKLGTGIVHLSKIRDKDEPSKIMRDEQIAGVEGRICLVFDDMIDSAGTIQTAAVALHNSGAQEIIVAATHGIFSGEAFARLNDSPIDKVLVTDTLSTDDAEAALGDRLRVVRMAPVLGRALTEIVSNGSVSQIFEDQNYM